VRGNYVAMDGRGKLREPHRADHVTRSQAPSLLLGVVRPHRTLYLSFHIYYFFLLCVPSSSSFAFIQCDSFLFLQFAYAKIFFILPNYYYYY